MNYQEAKAEVLKIGYPCAWMETDRGAILVRKNQPIKTIETHLKRFENYLNTTSLVDGYYCIKVIPSISSKDEPITVKFWHGSEKNASTMAENKNISYAAPDLSLEKYMDLIQENATMKAELEYLRRENIRLQERADHLEETADGLREGAAANLAAGPAAKPVLETLSEIIVAVAPIATGFFEQYKESKAAAAKTQESQFSQIAKAMNAMNLQTRQMAEQIQELKKTAPAPAPDPQPDPLTLEELAELVRSGQATMEEAGAAIDGQPDEVKQQFYSLVYGN